MKKIKEESPATSIGNASVAMPPSAKFKPEVVVDRRRKKGKEVLLKRFRQYTQENG